MIWRLVLPLGLLGPLMGGLVVRGVFPEGTDRFAWLVVVVVCAVACALRARGRELLHGAVVGFWNGASATLLQALFFDATVRNNPWMLARFADQPPGFDLEFFIYMLVPFIGVAGGAMTGLLAMAAAHVPRRGAKKDGNQTAP